MPTTPPTVWLLDGAPDPATFDVAGWRVRPLVDVGIAREPRTLLVGEVADARSAGIAVGAAALGTSVAVHLGLTGSDRQRFLEDLARLEVAVASGRPTPPPPTTEQQELLDLLAAGATVTDASRRLHVSRRTANRMLDDVRTLLGVTTTAEAVRVWTTRARER